MSDLYTSNIQSYLESLIPVRDAVLTEMEKYAKDTGFPIVGPQVGRVLYQIARLKNPRKIFELGSGFGYSAYWFCLGAPEAEIICTERSKENIQLALNWFKQAGLIDKVTFKQGDAKEILKQVGGQYDIIMNDVDKPEYPEVFHQVLNHLTSDGLLITDNVLWHGKVADPGIKDESTEGIREHNRLIFNTEGIFSTILPLRDGISISMKI